MIVGEREEIQLMIKLPVFQNKKCLLLHNNFVSISMLGILFPRLNESKNSHIFLGGTNPQIPKLKLEQTTLVCLHPRFAGTVLNATIFL